MIDEVEKAFAGASGGGQNDSGVSSRMFGTFLSWLNDHESDVFVVCTANDVAKLPPEFARAERFDGVFFVDLPGREQKDAIWQIYLEQFGLDAEQNTSAGRISGPVRRSSRAVDWRHCSICHWSRRLRTSCRSR